MASGLLAGQIVFADGHSENWAVAQPKERMESYQLSVISYQPEFAGLIADS